MDEQLKKLASTFEPSRQPFEVVTDASLKALTEAALKHFSRSRGSSGPLEYKVYPNKEDLPPDLHQAQL